ncbi:MAG TPA: IPT/TIG domain-containing protein [Gemmatimonadaceae bacterium]
MAAPTITSIVPATGTASGGTSVAIVGTGLTGATAVTFGSAPASSFAVISDTQIVAASPAGSGSVAVSVTTPSGASGVTAGSTFLYSAASSTPTTDPALVASLANGLMTMLQSATSPDALEAQSILLRRLALEGDIIPSRVPAPRNITEIGGYFNLLGKLHEPAMREQALAGILGVAGPTTPLGWVSTIPLSMVAVTNDRPAGPAQPTIPLTFYVRSDFVTSTNAALTYLHQRGCTLPLASSAPRLPSGMPGATPPADALPFLGRTLDIVAATALSNPATDPIALVKPQGSATPFQIASNVLNAGSVTVPPAAYDAVQCNSTTCATVTLASQSVVDVAPVLANAGFYPGNPLSQPTNGSDSAWSRFTNVSGLVAGTTKLGDELALLYDAPTIAGSVFAGALDWVWNGAAFAAAP